MSSAAPSPPRQQIGPYQIVARIGAGGMGVVFKGWDPRLERDVAIKLLHPDAAGDADRQKHLLAEGRAASALNHPNILRVYDADVDGESYYLVSEWLEGKSLRDELSRGAVPTKRLLDLAVQIADGLAAAHAMGIVHRDIKPENIMLARDGTARIVDFGLARHEHRAAPEQETVQQLSTVSLEGGLSGTPPYMSPEQARGQAGDFRTDQFSFGTLIYEMATGVRAFRRDTVLETLAAVLHDEPKPLVEANRRVPLALAWIVEQCMTKDPTERYAATEDLARELRRVRDRLRETLNDATPVAADRRRPWRMAAIVASTAVVAVALAVLGDSYNTPKTALRFTPIASAGAYEGTPVWSADGQSVAYVADVDGVLQVFVKRVADALSRQVTHTRFDAQRPFWAPNGQLLYFISLAGDREALWSVGAAGGTPELVLENVDQAAIDPSGHRLALMMDHSSAGEGRALWWSSPPGAPPTKETRQPPGTEDSVASQVAFNPKGQLLLWTSGVAGPQTVGGSLERFYLFSPDGTPPKRVLSHLARLTNLSSFSWLRDSRHVVIALPDRNLGNRHLWIADTQSDALQQITATHTNETAPAAAPVDGRIAYASDQVDFDLVLISPDGRTRQTLLATARNEFAPTWSPAGDQYAFATDRSGVLEIWSRSRDGQWERPIVVASDFGDSTTEALGSLTFSPDGRTLAYQRSSGGAFEVWLSPSTGGKPIRLLDPIVGTVPYQDSPAWSPDGMWISINEASNSDGKLTSGQQSLTKVRVGSNESIALASGFVAGYRPTRWSPDGKWILFQSREGLARVSADGGEPRVFSDEEFIDYTWAADSRRVYALSESEISGHFALIELDSVTGDIKIMNPDLGPIPIANQPIRGFSYATGQGFLTSLASARSDIWMLEGFQPPGNQLWRWLRP